MKSIAKVRFKNPPIIEVVIGSYFDPPLTHLRSEHIGLLWARFRNEFPNVEQREPLAIGAPGQEMLPTIGNDFLIMPRFWFVSDDETSLIQVQKNAFLLNWRKRDAEYPHFYEQIKPRFDRCFEIFEQFIREEIGISHPKIGLCELTYVDLIEPCDYWRDPQDTAHIIKSFPIQDLNFSRGEVADFNCTYRYHISPTLQLQVSLRTAVSSGEERSPRLVVESKAIGPVGGVQKSDTDSWYANAHDVIVDWFLRMTDAEIQRDYWIAQEGN